MEKVSNNFVEPSTSNSSANKPKKSKASVGIAIMVGIILIVLIVVLLDRFVGVNIFTSKEQREQEKVADFVAETGSWHAVFLTNGQVYFGQLERPEAQYARLSDVYYLQLQSQNQASLGSSGTGQASQIAEGDGSQVIPAPQPSPPRLTLIKFGTELHGPQDYMEINRDHILFWEELKPDSQVVQAIARYKEGQ